MTWVITGGSSGVGLQLASDLAHAGEEVLVWDRIAPGNADLAHDSVDLLVAEEIEQAADRLSGPVKAFVHCAGIAQLTHSTDPASATALRTAFEIHVVAFTVAVRALLPRLAAGASVIAITSSAQKLIFPGTLAYGVSKAALERAVQQMAVELAPRKVRVNAVCPGAVSSPMTAAAWADPSEAAARRRFIPLERQAEPGEVSAAVRFLASDAAAFITGETLWVDGGTRLGMYNEAIRAQQPAAE